MIFSILEPLAIISLFLLSFVFIRKDFSKSLYLLLIFSVLLHKELFSFYKWDLMPIRAYMFAFFCNFVFQTVEHIVKRREIKQYLKSYLNTPASYLLLIYWLVCGVSIYFTLNLKASLLLFGFLTTVVFLFIQIISTTSKDEKISLGYVKFYIFIASLLTLFGYFQALLYLYTGKIVGALWNIPGNFPRIGTTFWDVNHFAGFLAALLPISAILFFIEPKTKSKVFYFLSTLSLTVTLLLTNSRTAWIMFFVSVIIFSLMLLYKKFGRKGVIFLYSSLFVLTLLVFGMYSQKQGAFRAAVKQYFHYRLDSYDSHMLLISGAVEIFAKYPYLGGGYGGFFEHFNKTKIGPMFYARDPAAFTTRVPAHTIWGELLSGTGILGFSVYVLFCFFSVGFLFYKWAKSKDIKSSLIPSAMGAALIGWLVAGIFYSYNAEFFWIIWGLYTSYGLTQKNEIVGVSDFFKWVSSNSSILKNILMGISLVLIFWSLGKNHLIPWDEAIYAKISKNMIINNDYLSQSWKPLTVWFEKPPFFMWSQAFFMMLFGYTSLAVRLPSAIFGFLTVWLVYKMGERLFSKTAGFVSALSLITTTHFLYYSRTGMLDVTATFFITLSIYLYLLLKEKSDQKAVILPFLIGASIGFAAMTKGVVGLAPFPLIFVFEVLSRNKIGFKTSLTIVCGFAITALPWHLYMYYLYGQAFFQNYIGYHVFDRATSAIEDKGNPIWWYLIILKVSMRIWFVWLLLSFPYAVYSSFKKNNKIFPFVVWFAFILLLFSVAKSKLVWYIIPLYPAAAIINGYFLDILINKALVYIDRKNLTFLKFGILYSMSIFALVYLFLNSNLVYTSDLTGSQSRLMLKKDEVFGSSSKVFLDRVELPLALFYLNSPYEIIDFVPTKPERVPVVWDTEKLILLTKKGRFSLQIPGYGYEPTVVAEDGDWVLWYFPPRAKSPKI